MVLGIQWVRPARRRDTNQQTLPHTRLDRCDQLVLHVCGWVAHGYPCFGQHPGYADAYTHPGATRVHTDAYTNANSYSGTTHTRSGAGHAYTYSNAVAYTHTGGHTYGCPDINGGPARAKCHTYTQACATYLDSNSHTCAWCHADPDKHT